MKTSDIMNIEFQLASEEDLPAILKIYNYYVLNSTATFHTEELVFDDFKAAFVFDHPIYRTWLIKVNNILAGYCQVIRYKPRQAYNRTAEVSIYLDQNYTGKGIGFKALNFIEEMLKGSFVKTILGVITAENKGSIKTFEKAGFIKCAHFKNVGEKFGRILDVVCLQKELN